MNIKQKRKPHLRSGYKVDAILYEWFQIQRTRNISVSGDILQQKALEFANHLGNHDFKASTGGLILFFPGI